MSNLNVTNTKLPAEGPKHKQARKSPRLQEKYGQKGQVTIFPQTVNQTQLRLWIVHKFLFIFLFDVLIFGVKDCYENKILKKLKLYHPLYRVTKKPETLEFDNLD